MGWQWHQLDHMQIICTSLQTDNHASTSPLSFYFLQARCPSCHPTNSMKALKETWALLTRKYVTEKKLFINCHNDDTTLTCIVSCPCSCPDARKLLDASVLCSGTTFLCMLEDSADEANGQFENEHSHIPYTWCTLTGDDSAPLSHSSLKSSTWTPDDSRPAAAEAVKFVTDDAGVR